MQCDSRVISSIVKNQDFRPYELVDDLNLPKRLKAELASSGATPLAIEISIEPG